MKKLLLHFLEVFLGVNATTSENSEDLFQIIMVHKYVLDDFLKLFHRLLNSYRLNLLSIIFVLEL